MPIISIRAAHQLSDCWQQIYWDVFDLTATHVDNLQGGAQSLLVLSEPVRGSPESLWRSRSNRIWRGVVI